MGIGTVREGDSTTGTCNVGAPCCPHGRSGICYGDTNVFINGKMAIKTGDTGNTYCPHGGTFITDMGSSTVNVNGKPLNLIGDSTPCQVCGISGTIISGSDNVFAGK